MVSHNEIMDKVRLLPRNRLWVLELDNDTNHRCFPLNENNRKNIKSILTSMKPKEYLIREISLIKKN